LSARICQLGSAENGSSALKILLTAFEPYDDWSENSSWLALVELLKHRPTEIELVTRRYPVDLLALRARLYKDLTGSFDAVLHLGQAPGATGVKLESVALNVAGCINQDGEELPQIVDSAPLAFSSQMPLGRWVRLLRENQIPSLVSYHAGTFLCNATMYLSHHWYHSRRQNVPIAFIHLPLATEQVAANSRALPSMSTETLARALRIILSDYAQEGAQQSQVQRFA
jgi:pyroglutamyl-peptidase